MADKALILLILFVPQVQTLHRLPENESCWLEVSELRNVIRNLENQYALGQWQLKDLKDSSYNWENSLVYSKNLKKENSQYKSSFPSTSGNLIVYDHDCSMIYNRRKVSSGFYRIKPQSIAEPFLVYCDMSDGTGWTVIQRRTNGKVKFDRSWSDYKNGFGHFKKKNDEYWLGNEYIHSLLLNDGNLMQIDLTDWKEKTAYAIYENVKVADEKDNYRLQFGIYSGTAGDALSGGGNVEEQWSVSHNGMQFSTADQDHDRYLHGNCAKENKGGWWFNRCHAANLNGKYYRRGSYTGKNDNGLIWFTWHGWWYSLKSSSIKVRQQAFLDDLGSGNGRLL
ncbi:fibrinogen like 1B [Polypterus senegalus]|uniref:fibrinogen like 1B n=1 Tax=Polypterus senegalus TaxID=55291 RepID=UPI0019626345|nr:fibrinogen like 1B [Polypterus senegalus]